MKLKQTSSKRLETRLFELQEFPYFEFYSHSDRTQIGRKAKYSTSSIFCARSNVCARSECGKSTGVREREYGNRRTGTGVRERLLHRLITTSS